MKRRKRARRGGEKGKKRGEKGQKEGGKKGPADSSCRRRHNIRLRGRKCPSELSSSPESTLSLKGQWGLSRGGLGGDWGWNRGGIGVG